MLPLIPDAKVRCKCQKSLENDRDRGHRDQRSVRSVTWIRSSFRSSSWIWRTPCDVKSEARGAVLRAANGGRFLVATTFALFVSLESKKTDSRASFERSCESTILVYLTNNAQSYGLPRT